MTYPESELYEGIEKRLSDTAIADYWTNEGHVAPATIGLYNQDYDDLPDKIPFNRPAVFVEFDDYDTEDLGGYMKDTIPMIVHVVQDIYVTGRNVDISKEQSHKDLLKYADLVRYALHKHRIGMVVLDVRGMVPDHDHRNLLIHRIRINAIVRSRFFNAEEAIILLGEMKTETSVSAAQILQAHNTPVELVPAPGAGKAIIPSKFAYIYKAGGSPYSGTGNNNVLLQGATQIFNDFVDLNLSVDKIGYRPVLTNVEHVGLENVPLIWQVDSAVTGGDGTVKIIVWYDVIEV